MSQTLRRLALGGMALTGASLTAGLAVGAAQSAASGGWTCRAAWSANAAGKEFGFVWVRLNAGDTADVWTAPGAPVPPESIPATPPDTAHHQSAGQVSRFGTNIVGVTYQPPRGNPVMVMVDQQSHMLSTTRQKAPVACTP